MLQSLGYPGVDLGGAEPGCPFGSNTGPAGTLLLENILATILHAEYKESSILSSKRSSPRLAPEQENKMCSLQNHATEHLPRHRPNVFGIHPYLKYSEVMTCRVVLSNKPQEASTGSQCLLGCLPTPCPARLPHSNWPSSEMQSNNQ